MAWGTLVSAGAGMGLFGLEVYRSITKKEDVQESVHEKIDTPAKKFEEANEKSMERAEDAMDTSAIAYAEIKNIPVEQAKRELVTKLLEQKSAKQKTLSDKQSASVPEKNAPAVTVEKSYTASFLDDSNIKEKLLRIFNVLFENAHLVLGEIYLLKFLKALRFLFIILATGYNFLPESAPTVLSVDQNINEGLEFFGFEVETLYNVIQTSGQIIFVGVFAALVRKYVAALKMPAENVAEKYKALEQTLSPLENVVNIIAVGIPSAFTLAYFIKYAFTESFSVYVSVALVF